jgi:predicted RNA methylase
MHATTDETQTVGRRMDGPRRRTREQLLEAAGRLHIEGASRMKDLELKAAVQRATNRYMGRSWFFDEFPRFYETGNSGPGARINARHDVLIAAHKHLIQDRTILDIGSHNGRWGFAAIIAGAKHVMCIEPRGELVESAKENYEAYGIDPSRYSFHTADALEALRELRPQVDTVFLFGILYHVYYHVELVKAIHQTEASAVIVDTNVAPLDGLPAQLKESGQRMAYANAISFYTQRVDRINNGAMEIFPGAGVTIAGCPTRRAVHLLFEAFQFDVAEIPWDAHLSRWRKIRPAAVRYGLKDYAAGERGTFLAQRRPRDEPADDG